MQTQTIASAISSLSGLLSDPQVSFEGLATLHGVREQINDLFDSYAADLRETPGTESMWNAVAAAMVTPSSITAATTTTHENHVAAFWREHADRFTWDFVPMEVVHEVYVDWIRRRHPSESALARTPFSKQLRKVLPGCGPWRYTRARAGALTRGAEPLARNVGWRPDGSNPAIYGLRRHAA